LTLLAVLAAASTAVTLAGFAGARRADSVLDRFLVTTHARDVGAFVQSADLTRHPDHVTALRDTIAGLHGVSDVAIGRGYPMQVGTKYDFSVAASPDGSYFTRIDAPLVLRGRLPHPSSVDEVAISDTAARELHLGPGDTLRGSVFDPDTVAGFISPVPSAPSVSPPRRISLRIVGVVRTQDELQGQQNGSWATVNALSGAGVSSIGQVATIGEDFGNDAGTAYRAIAAATLAFSVVALLATLLTLTLATGRQIGLASETDRVGWGLGLSHRQRAQAVVTPPALALAVGLVVGFAGSVGLSFLFPLSTARLAEPTPGIRFDPIVHLGGLAALAVLLGAMAVAVAIRSLDRPSSAEVSRRARWMPRLADGHIPAMIGLRQAFDTGEGRRSVPSLGARIGAVVSVAGVVAVAVLVASIHVAQNEPARFGWTWDSRPDITDPSAMKKIGTGLQHESGVIAAGELLGDVAEVGHTPMSLRAIRDIKGSTPMTVTKGRMPSGPDDVAVGAQTMRDLGLDPGRQVTIADKQGGRHRMTVVGQVVLPPVDSSGELGTGAVVTASTFQLLAGDGSSQNLVLTYRRGTDHAALEHRLTRLGLGFPVYARPEAPGLILQLNRMGSLALALMLFLAALGSAGLLHFLAASVRARRSEFGCLRAVGMVRSQIWGAVTWQAVAVSVVGLVVGVPLGIVLGRAGWRAAVGRIGMVDDPAVAVWAVLAVIAVVLVGSVLLAAGPGWAATRRSPAALLRSE
jgi:ABC-type lipoprotein release transport system permease subunit